MLYSLFFVPLGVLLLGLGWFLHKRASQRAAAADSWPRTTGEVLSSEVSVSEESQHRALVAYRYQVGGTEHVGKRICFGDNLRYQDAEEAAGYVARYPAGGQVDVRYNPDRPVDAVLETAAPKMNKWLLILGGVMIVLGPALDLLG